MLVTLDNYAEAMEHLDKCEVLFTDTETTGLFPWAGDRLIGISCRGGGRSFYFPFRHVTGSLPVEHIKRDFGPLLSKPHVRYVGYHYDFDLQFMYIDGVPLPPAFEEVSTMGHLLNENEQSHALKALAKKYLPEQQVWEDEHLKEVLLKQGLGKGQMWKLPPHEIEPYACADVDLTEGLRAFYEPHLRTWKLYDLWREINEYVDALLRMSIRGLLLDVPLIHQYIEEAEREKLRSLAVIRELSGDPKINGDTHKRNQKWLGVPTTAHEYLEEFCDGMPGVQELLECRGWSKVNNTHYKKYLEWMDERNRLHANFNYIGTETGRLSVSKPPLQAVPKPQEHKPWMKVKDVVLADEGWLLLEADYSMAELRVGSHYAQERTMQDKLNRGADLHSETAEEANVPRDDGKRITFSAFYGIGKKTLAERLRIPVHTAGERLKRWHGLYPGVRRLYNRAQAMAEERKYIRMYTGRMRHYNTPFAPTHKASSNLIQGSVAEMIRIAITRLHKELGLKMLLQVHDSVIAMVRREELAAVAPEVSRVMTDTPWMTTKNRVDMKAGDRWGSLKKLDINDTAKAA